MKTFSLVLCLVFFHPAVAQQDPCRCIPKVGEIRPYRLQAKWDTLGHTYPRAARPVTATTLHRWEVRYAGKANGTTVAWNTPRVKNTPEDSLYTLKGYLWYIKMERDCDYHIQIGRKSRSAGLRAVVEPTIKQCSLQSIILDTLLARGYTMTQLRRGVELDRGIPVIVEGLGFYDWQHQFKHPPEDTPDGSPLWKQAGTAWELHPITSMKFGH